MAIEEHVVKISTTGSAGSATGSSQLALPLCELIAVHFDYHASAPATSDLVIKAPSNPGEVTVLTLTNNATDKWIYPRIINQDNAGADITGSYSPPIVHDGLNFALSGSDALTDAVVMTVYVRV